jgi:RNA polymerase sigma-70 factor, ECF subfamily
MDSMTRLRMIRVAARYVGWQDAEDVVHNAALSAHKSAFRGESEYDTWIHRITVNAALSWLRAKGRDRLVFTDDLFDVPYSDTPETVAEKADLYRTIKNRMANLKPEHREVLGLYVKYDDYSLMASLIGVSEGTIKSRLSRAREIMRG